MEQNKLTINGDSLLFPFVFGNFDSNVKIIENAYDVSINYRGEKITISGSEDNIHKANKIIEKLFLKAKNNQEINEQLINYIIDMSSDNENTQDIESFDKDVIALTVTRKAVKAKTVGQKRYVDAIKNNTVVFGIGPAGTGKTYLAMAMAIKAFKNNEVNRIILTRPAIEAGENLGFLPGDLQQKVDPYLRPLYDALYEIMGAETFLKNMEKGLIEVAPLAYMRGRTLDNAFIVLDEAQNTTPEQMKMFLTRIGFGSKAVITGDLTQIDLPRGKSSGLTEACKILDGVKDINIARFNNKDVVRHPLVQSIIKAYEDADKDKQKINEREQKREELQATKERMRGLQPKRKYITRDDKGNIIRNNDRR